MSGSYRVQLKGTVVNPNVVTSDLVYTYDLEAQPLLANKLKLVSSYTDAGDDLNVHELEVSIAKITGTMAFVKVDPFWNYLEPSDRTYEAIGTGSYSYEGEVYDGVFDIANRSLQVKFQGTISSNTRVYIITSLE